MTGAPVDPMVCEIESVLRAVSANVRKRGRAILVDFDITTPQFDALVIVDDMDQLTIGDLSAALGLAYSTTTDLVDRLERRAFVQRVRDVEDKRVVRVRLLDEGVGMIRRVLDARQKYLAEALAAVSTAEREQLLQVLSSLLLHLREA